MSKTVTDSCLLWEISASETSCVTSLYQNLVGFSDNVINLTSSNFLTYCGITLIFMGAMFVDCQNLPSSSGRNCMGNWFVALQFKRQFITLLNIRWDENSWVRVNPPNPGMIPHK